MPKPYLALYSYVSRLKPSITTIEHAPTITYLVFCAGDRLCAINHGGPRNHSFDEAVYSVLNILLNIMDST